MNNIPKYLEESISNMFKEMLKSTKKLKYEY